MNNIYESLNNLEDIGLELQRIAFIMRFCYENPNIKLKDKNDITSFKAGIEWLPNVLANLKGNIDNLKGGLQKT